MLQQGDHIVIGFLHDVLDCALAQRNAQGQGVNKHPQYLIRPRTALQTAGEYGAKHHVIAAAGLCQHLRPRDMEQHTGADPETTRLSTDSVG
ncbi:hypothetical protein Xkoz_03648 [Xenorhabdus kozodoii]|uniref:Uncharacterized protein n=1 Tax=Xenorhabdus kozodoii TaxID=351676 RepID=A0A2D0KZ42_9GAMM|nr:hypothetical protein Xkoz_03648 [Xenorhabdus kozodoii]